MNSTHPTSQQLSQAIDSLPKEALFELANFIEYLRFKCINSSVNKEQEENHFLLAIAGLGESNEKDLSERDEEVLKQEIDQIRGFFYAGNK